MPPPLKKVKWYSQLGPIGVKLINQLWRLTLRSLLQDCTPVTKSRLRHCIGYAPVRVRTPQLSCAKRFLSFRRQPAECGSKYSADLLPQADASALRSPHIYVMCFNCLLLYDSMLCKAWQNRRRKYSRSFMCKTM